MLQTFSAEAMETINWLQAYIANVEVQPLQQLQLSTSIIQAEGFISSCTDNDQ